MKQVFADASEADYDTLKRYAVEFTGEFGYDADKILEGRFSNFCPRWQPYAC